MLRLPCGAGPCRAVQSPTSDWPHSSGGGGWHPALPDFPFLPHRPPTSSAWELSPPACPGVGGRRSLRLLVGSQHQADSYVTTW